MTTAEKLMAIAEVIKKRFGNLTTREVLQLASDVLKAIGEDN